MSMWKKQREFIEDLSERELLVNVYITQLILLIIAIMIGIWQYDTIAAFLLLWKWDVSEIFLLGGISSIAIVFLNSWLMKILPFHMYDDGGINRKIFENRSISHLAFLCLVISFVEEILFRGVLQVHFGLFWASLIFALVHLRYLEKWFLLTTVTILSFYIGLLFLWTENLYVTIATHFFINFMSALHIKRQSKQNENNRGDDGGT